MKNWKLFEIGLKKEPALTTGQIFRTRWCDELYAKINDVLHQEHVDRAVVYCASKKQAQQLDRQLTGAEHFNSCVSVDAAVENLERFYQGEINFILVIDHEMFAEITQVTKAVILRKFSVPHRVREIVAAGHSCVYDFGNNLEVLYKDEATAASASSGGENLPFEAGYFGGWVKPIFVQSIQFKDQIKELCEVQGWKFSVK